MSLKYSFIMCVASLFGASDKQSKPAGQSAPSKPIYDYTLNALSGESVNLGKYKGKKMLIVNVASKCGYTPQYKELEQLHDKYGDKISILGFPANNFGGQEPGSHEEIAAFCQKNYGVSFQMFEKISVKGNDMHPLYKWLSTKSLNGWNDAAPGWNFCKYLIDEEGNLLEFFKSGVSPMSEDITKYLK